MAELNDIVKNLMLSATSAVVAEAITLPFDTAKVRLQLQNVSGKKAIDIKPKYKGSFGTIKTIISEEGLSAPFKGLVPGIHRQILFTGLRLGLYEKFRNLFSGDLEESTLHARVGAALTTSAIGITVANPSDVVKVRLQAAEARRKMSTFDIYRGIVRNEGICKGLYRGYLPNLVRNSVISATELVAYDVVKSKLLEIGMPDNVGIHFSAGLSAGLAATILGSPWDVIGTRLMARTSDSGDNFSTDEGM